MNLGASGRPNPNAAGPGFTLQFLSTTLGRLRDFRFNPLRDFVFGTDSPAGKFHSFIRAGYYSLRRPRVNEGRFFLFCS
jgi:hypothetical protein